MRLVLTGGVSPDGMHFDPETPTFFIVTHELFDVPASVYVSGAKLLAVEHRRELPEAKTTDYLTWLGTTRDSSRGRDGPALPQRRGGI